MGEHPLVIRGGTLIGSDEPIDVAIDEHGDVAAVEAGLSGRYELDADGATLMPGLVDLHAHLREPGFEDAETVESASRAAALGGYTAIVAMPDTWPVTDSAGAVREVQALADKALCQVEIAGCLTVGAQGMALAPMAEMAALGVRIFTDVTSVVDTAVLRRAMDYAAGLGVVVAETPLDSALAAGGQLHEGLVSARLGMAGIPDAAEEIVVARDLALARLTGARLHLMSVTLGSSVSAIASARAQGSDVTFDVTPHHLTLTDRACVGFDPAYKVTPPLRPDAERAALADALAAGAVDAVATGHAPQTPDSKEHPFDVASSGTLGLEHALGVLLTHTAATMADVALVGATKPAAIAGIEAGQGGPIAPGRPANIAVVDLAESWTVDSARLASRSRNTAWAGSELTGRVRHTICNGEPVVINGEACR